MQNRIIDVKFIRSTFLIDQNETQLLKKIEQGDKVALVHLCLLKMPYILNTVQNEQVIGIPMAKQMEVGMQGFITAVDEHLANPKSQNGEQPEFWFYGAVRKSLQTLGGEEYKAIALTPAEIEFLNKLNKMLTVREHQIVARALELVRHCELRKENGELFTVDYRVEVEVDYYISCNEGDPAHTYRTTFNAQDLLPEKKEYNLLCDKEDWAEPGWPALDEKYCYLMHDLLDQSHLGDHVYEVNMIWFDIVMHNQDNRKIFPDGSSTLIQYKEDEWNL